MQRSAVWWELNCLRRYWITAHECGPIPPFGAGVTGREMKPWISTHVSVVLAREMHPACPEARRSKDTLKKPPNHRKEGVRTKPSTFRTHTPSCIFARQLLDRVVPSLPLEPDGRVPTA